MERIGIIYGTNGFGLNNNNDFIVPEIDSLLINQKIISQNKTVISLKLRHNQLPDDKKVKEKIIEEVNKN